MSRFCTVAPWIVFALAVTQSGCASRTCEPAASLNQRAGGGLCNMGQTGYLWTGSSCIQARSCADRADQIYPTQSSCETAHIGCTGRRP